MRITFISAPVNSSGGIRVMVIYCQQLMRMGHSVRIVSIPFEPIPFRRKLKSWLQGKGWPRRPLRAKSHVDGSGVDHHVLDRSRPVTDVDVPDADVVIATWWETAEWVNALGPDKGAKVYFIQGHEVFEGLPVDRCRATYRMPLHKIVIAPWLKQLMHTEYGDAVVDLVPNSVDRKQFYAPVRGKQRVPTVGVLYSATPFKGLKVTLAAIAIVRARFPDLRIVSFGSDPLDPALSLPQGAEFTLAPPQERLREFYAQCDVWVTASRSEGFNLPALEAMACRTPVVSTRTGWPADAIKTGWNGVLVDVDDVAGLARGIEWVLSRSDDEWKTLSANAHATSAVGSWEESARLFEAALEHACRRAERGEIGGRCSKAALTRG